MTVYYPVWLSSLEYCVTNNLWGRINAQEEVSETSDPATLL